MGKTRLGTGYRVRACGKAGTHLCVLGWNTLVAILVLGAVSHGCEEGMLEMGWDSTWLLHLEDQWSCYSPGRLLSFSVWPASPLPAFLQLWSIISKCHPSPYIETVSAKETHRGGGWLRRLDGGVNKHYASSDDRLGALRTDYCRQPLTGSSSYSLHIAPNVPSARTTNHQLKMASGPGLKTVVSPYGALCAHTYKVIPVITSLTPYLIPCL